MSVSWACARVMVTLAWVWWASCAHAQAREDELGPEERVERYMERLGLDDLLAAQLRDRLMRTPPSGRVAVAEHLGAIYVRQLRAAGTVEERRRIEQLADQLLSSVEESQSYDLRIEIAKARYLEAEASAERARLLLIDKSQQDEAIRVLSSVRSTFGPLSVRLHREVENLEREERSAGGRDRLAEIERRLTEARRLRSLAKYYSGWTNYYLAELTQQQNFAVDAIGEFAYLLSAGGERMPTADRLPRNLLQYEHVARSALGVSMAHSLRGDDAAALRWLEIVINDEGVPEAVRRQFFSRRVMVYSQLRRWADIEWMLHQRARRGEEGMSVQEARLLAVRTLGSLRHARSGGTDRDALIHSLAQAALAELVRRGEVGHVLDLVSTFEAEVVGSDGFIVRYVNGLRQYEATRRSHAESSEDDQEPTATPVTAARYRQAAVMLSAAAEAADASEFATQRARCRVLAGLSQFFAGDLEQAARTLQAAYASAPDAASGEEALWYAIVALDRAVERERTMLAPRRDELSAIFLQTYPRSERAAKLLIRRAGSELADPQQAVRVLLAVQPDSPLYHAARSHASTLLYRLFRASPGSERDFAALRFVEVAEEVVELDRHEAISGDGETMARAGEAIVLRLRQVVDALLSMTAPDYARAARTLDMIDQTARVAGIADASWADELAYRRLQLAIGQGRQREAEEHLVRLRASGGRYAEAADNLMYRTALAAYVVDTHNVESARTLLRHGLRLADTIGVKPGALQQAAIQSVFHRTAEAAAVVWTLEQDLLARDTGLRLDRMLLEAGVRSQAVLRRHAELAEAAGDDEGALDSWRHLLSALPQGSDAWYEARYHSARLLALRDPERGLEVLDQHAALHPQYGPEPWGQRLRMLHAEVRGKVAASSMTGGSGG
ncbi:MAG: hypothetical protein KIT24_02615 [Phycisphaeraceae bacterium]|nr:hypothetical protein [Phycisphaeraceae bacterium]